MRNGKSFVCATHEGATSSSRVEGVKRAGDFLISSIIKKNQNLFSVSIIFLNLNFDLLVNSYD